VVGGGLVGTTAAYFLALRGCDVVLLERSEIACGATGRSLGLLRAGTHLPYAVARENHGPEVARTLRQLTGENHALIRGLVERLRIDCGYARAGSLWISESAESRRTIEALRSDGFVAEERSEGAYFPEDGEFDPVRFVRALAAEAERAGARLYEKTPVESIRGGRLRTPQGRVEAEMILVASNAWASGLVGLFEEVIAPVRSQCLATEPLPERLRSPLRLHGGMDVLRQLSGGIVLASGGRHVSPNREYTLSERTTEPIQSYLESLVRDRVGLPIRVTHRWAGPMAFTCDELPCIGPLPGTVSLYAAVGWHGSDLSLGFVGAKTVAEMMLDGRTSYPSTLFSLRRHL